MNFVIVFMIGAFFGTGMFILGAMAARTIVEKEISTAEATFVKMVDTTINKMKEEDLI